MIPLILRARVALILIWLQGLIICPIYPQAQLNNTVFERIGISEGLPFSQVSDIAQDSHGFLWFVSGNSLVRYDGYTFRLFMPDYTDNPSLSQKNIRKLFPLINGEVWFSFAQGGLGRVDPRSENFTSYFSNDSPKNGLANNQINQVYQDSSGRVWLATLKGLFEYNSGNDNFSPVVTAGTTTNCLSQVSVMTLFEDNSKNLWLGTDKGLFLLDSDSGRYFQFSNEAHNHHSLCNNNVITIIQTPDGSIWAGTSWGLNRLRNYPVNEGKVSQAFFERYLFDEVLQSYVARKSIHTLEVDHSGNLWVGTGLGISRLNYGKHHPSEMEHFFYQPQFLNHLGNNIIPTIRTDSRGNVWFFSQDKDMGLGMFDNESQKFLFHINQPGNPFSLSNNLVDGIFEDNSGNLWISCTRGGLNKLDIYSQNTRFIFPIPGSKNSLNTGDVYAIYHDHHQQILWVGTIKGLNRIDLSNGNIDTWEQKTGSARHLSANIVGAIKPDPEGFLWIGYYDYKISKFFPDRGIFEHFEFTPEGPVDFQGWSVRDIFIDSEENVWFSTWSDGIYIYERKTQQFSLFEKLNTFSGRSENIRINKVLEAAEGLFFIATSEHGLFLFNKQTGELKNYQNAPGAASSLSTNTINDIYLDSKRNLWIATNHGLFHAPPTEDLTFHNFRVKESALANQVHAITEDKMGFIWISTGKGIKGFNPVKKEFLDYSIPANLFVNEYNARAVHRSPEGILYFGGVNGIVSFNPAETSKNPHTPRVEFTALRIRNQNVTPGEKLNGQTPLEHAFPASNRIVLNSRNNDFALEFAALHYAAPQLNKYAFQLEPYDKEWKYTDATNRVATYTNLPPGEYVFRVIASNKDEVWNLEGKTIMITILPAWHQTFLFRILLFILFILSLVLFIRLRTYQLRQRKKELEFLVTERTERISEMDRMKTNFFTNLSHEIRTPLTLIIGPLDNLINKTNAEGRASEELGIIRRNAYRLLKMVNQLLDYRKVESGGIKLVSTHGELREFLWNVLELFKPHAQGKNLNLELHAGFDKMYVYFDQDILEKILFNLLSNSIKNTPSGGDIKLKAGIIERNPEKIKFRISVEDTGKGIAKEDLPNIFNNFYQAGDPANLTPQGSGIGLAYTRELVQLINGKIEVESEPGKGTVFTINVAFQPSSEESEIKSEKSARLKYSQNALQVEKHLLETVPEHKSVSGENKPLVLLVEDDADMAHFVSSSLQHEFNVLQAADGMQGWETAIEHIPDLIISDLMMPVMDGYQLSRKLKEDKRTCHIPLILLTAKSSDDSRLRGLTTGAEAYVGKPFSMEILKAQINSLLLARERIQEKFRSQGWIKVKEVEFASLDLEFLNRLVSIIEEKIAEPELDSEFLATQLGMSKSQLYRKIKALTSLSVNLFIRDIKLTRAAQLLKNNSVRVSEVAYMTGFNNVSYFTRSFSEKFGKSPSEFARGN